MKKLIVKTFPFAFLFVFLNYWILNKSVFYSKEKTYEKAIQESSQASHFFLGDSHIDVLKELSLSNDVSNMAFGGDGIQEMYIKTRILLEENENIKTIFILTEPQLFNSSVSPNKSFLSSYVLALNEEEVYGKNKISYLTEQIPLFSDGFIEYTRNKYIYGLLKLILKKNKAPQKHVLWQNRTKEARDLRCVETGKQDHKGIFSLPDSKMYFSKIVKLCKEKDIKVIGVRFPVEPLFYAQCPAEDLRLVDNYIDSLQFDQELDFSLFFNSPQYFVDEDHITKEGAKLIVEEIRSQTGVIVSKN